MSLENKRIQNLFLYIHNNSEMIKPRKIKFESIRNTQKDLVQIVPSNVLQVFLVFSKVQLHSNELNYKNNFPKHISNKDSVNINF